MGDRPQWPTQPSWSDAYDLVRGLLAAGYPAARIELPGLRLSLRAGRPDEPDPPQDLVAVPAPVMGAGYRRPAPDAPPFVEVGSEVVADTVVAIVEVMKLMVSVEAGLAGRVAAIRFADGESVEEGQPLMLIAPTPDASHD